MMFNTIRVFDPNDDVLADILRLETECFPSDWLYETAEGHYTERMSDVDNINMVLQTSQCEVVGYALAVLHDTAKLELLDIDPDMRNDADRYYLETVQISPKARGLGGLRQLLLEVCRGANKRGVRRFSIHARVTNEFNSKLKRIFHGKIKSCRKIDEWYWGGNEPYEYIEWTYSEDIDAR